MRAAARSTPTRGVRPAYSPVFPSLLPPPMRGLTVVVHFALAWRSQPAIMGVLTAFRTKAATRAKTTAALTSLKATRYILPSDF